MKSALSYDSSSPTGKIPGKKSLKKSTTNSKGPGGQNGAARGENISGKQLFDDKGKPIPNNKKRTVNGKK